MDNVETILNAGAAKAEIQTLNGVPYLVVPTNYRLENLETHLQEPVRKRGTLAFDDVESFGRYVDRHKGEGTSIFARGGSFRAILDHHGDNKAGWGQHQATYTPVATEEWKRWHCKNKIRMSQTDFAEFLEENQLQIVKPNGAEVLEIAKRLEAVSTVAFTSGVKLNNGNQELRYEETTEAKAGQKGQLQVPDLFTIGLSLYENGTAYQLTARLRYRIEAKELKLWYDLVNPHLVIKDALKEIGESITQITGIKPLNGAV